MRRHQIIVLGLPLEPLPSVVSRLLLSRRRRQGLLLNNVYFLVCGSSSTKVALRPQPRCAGLADRPAFAWAGVPFFAAGMPPAIQSAPSTTQNHKDGTRLHRRAPASSGMPTQPSLANQLPPPCLALPARLLPAGARRISDSFRWPWFQGPCFFCPSRGPELPPSPMSSCQLRAEENQRSPGNMVWFDRFSSTGGGACRVTGRESVGAADSQRPRSCRRSPAEALVGGWVGWMQSVRLLDSAPMASF
ncbi:uncharacterized protein B0H64DRAFT_123310 [Chaetomium fimeti]|uniref:Uncharacterized protein n=1 Tax=Chaetomium fimeti TaxID=1854472 RepID=A0AAE0LU34_9PEZI|nr:hypothetical protein B0H64DRAFT_123310 [Chaetomium fimeti]